MKQKNIIAILLAIILGGATASCLADSKNLIVKGKIAPPACQIAAPVEYDLDDIDLVNLVSPVIKELTQTWTITCSSAAPVKLKITDNKEGSASLDGENHFGLDKFTNSLGNEVKFGYYTITPTNQVVTLSNGAEESSGIGLVNKNNSADFANVNGFNKNVEYAFVDNGMPLFGKKFVVDLEVKATFDDKENILPYVQETKNFEGSAAIEVIMGL